MFFCHETLEGLNNEQLVNNAWWINLHYMYKDKFIHIQTVMKKCALHNI